MAQQTLQGFTYGRAVTLSDTVDIPLYEDRRPDALWVGVAGTVVAVLGNSETLTIKCPIGLLPLQGIKRVNSSSTTATDLVALWQL